MKKTMTLLACWALVACGNDTIPKPNPPVLTDSDWCSAACDRLRELRCGEGLPVKTGKACSPTMKYSCLEGECSDEGQCVVSCAKFCETTQSHGVWLQPKCVTRIERCDEVEACQFR